MLGGGETLREGFFFSGFFVEAGVVRAPAGLLDLDAHRGSWSSALVRPQKAANGTVRWVCAHVRWVFRFLRLGTQKRSWVSMVFGLVATLWAGWLVT